MSSEAIKVGVLVVGGGIQLLDLAAVDVLGSCDPSYLKALGLPDALMSKARPVELLYIAESGAGSNGALTSNGHILITHSFEDAGKLDYLVIPGPAPTYVTTPAEQEFIRAKFAEVSAVLTVCTGIIPALQSGILAGQRATAPRGMIPLLKQQAPDVEWVEKRWTTSENGKLWSSGAVTNGTDMLAAFVRESGAISPEIGNIICSMHDIGDRPQAYGSDLPAGFDAAAPPPS